MCVSFKIHTTCVKTHLIFRKITSILVKMQPIGLYYQRLCPWGALTKHHAYQLLAVKLLVGVWCVSPCCNTNLTITYTL